MSGHHDKLRSALDELQAQIDEMRAIDAGVASHLNSTIDQAKAVLAGRPTEAAEHRSMMAQLKEAGVSATGPESPLTASDKAKLLEHLKRQHGGGEEKRITLKRKETTAIRATDASGRARTVQVEVRGTTTIVTIDRPEVRNAVDGPTARALHEAFLAFDADDGQSVAVLTGAGGTFCAGADLKAVSTGNGNPVEAMTPGAPDDRALGPMGPTRLRLSKPKPTENWPVRFSLSVMVTIKAPGVSGSGSAL